LASFAVKDFPECSRIKLLNREARQGDAKFAKQLRESKLGHYRTGESVADQSRSRLEAVVRGRQDNLLLKFGFS